MSLAGYDDHDALGLAALVRAGEVTARELVDEALARLDALNPRLNAVVAVRAAAARAAAAGPLEGPLAGVPFLLKDLLGAIAGESTTCGSRLWQGHVAACDTELVRRFGRAGLICVGRSSTPELGILPVTEPEAYAPARNPWDLSRTPGGSSGGSAAAVAAGIVPLASGGDGGGSIRIPASCCGLFGLKPSRGRTPTGPEAVEHWQGCAVEHVLTRTVRDSAAVLDATHGPDPGAPYVAPPPARPFLEEVGAPPGRLRIAFTRRPLLPAPGVHPDCVAAVDEAAALCAELGHEVEEAHPPLDGDAFARAFVLMIIGEVAADLRAAERTLGRRVRHGDIEPGTHVLRLLGEAYSAADFALAVRDLKATGRVLAPFFARHDVLLTPTLATPPLPVGALTPRGAERALIVTLTRLGAAGALRALGVLERIAATAYAFAAFTAPFNASGQPAMSVPLHASPEGLPIGVQFAARPGEEGLLLRLAGQLEAARPWRGRRPPVHASALQP
ncbi:MAG: amidase [Planctomycetes bacterium]|nr:amidase [Planctomycetota bacterium]